MYKTFLLTFLSVFVIFATGANVQKKLEIMQKKQEGVQEKGVRGFFIQQKLAPSELFIRDSDPEPVKLEKLKIAPLTGITTSRAPLVPLPNLTSGSFISVQDYYKEKSELESKIMRLELSIEQLAGITESIQTSTIDNRSFLLKVIEIIIGAVVGGGGIFGAIVALRKNKT
jgi:hypothetical protein